MRIKKSATKKGNQMKKNALLGAITPWEVGPIPIAPQLHTDLVIDKGTISGAPHGLHTDRLCK